MDQVDDPEDWDPRRKAPPSPYSDQEVISLQYMIFLSCKPASHSDVLMWLPNKDAAVEPAMAAQAFLCDENGVCDGRVIGTLAIDGVAHRRSVGGSARAGPVRPSLGRSSAGERRHAVLAASARASAATSCNSGAGPITTSAVHRFCSLTAAQGKRHRCRTIAS